MTIFVIHKRQGKHAMQFSILWFYLDPSQQLGVMLYVSYNIYACLTLSSLMPLSVSLVLDLPFDFCCRECPTTEFSMRIDQRYTYFKVLHTGTLPPASLHRCLENLGRRRTLYFGNLFDSEAVSTLKHCYVDLSLISVISESLCLGNSE